jgi:uncharacterized protein
VKFKWWHTALAFPVLAYLGIAAFVGINQRHLIYHPPKRTAEQLIAVQQRYHLRPWTNSAGIRIGWWRPANGAATAGTWLITHGNAGSAGGRDYIIDPIQRGVAADVYVLEYPGYADRPGEPSQDSLLAAAREAFLTLPDRGPVTVVGESLGTGPACFLAGEFPDRVRGLILLVPYRELAEAAASHYPWLPVRLLLRDRFPAYEWLAKFKGPVAFGVAARDEVIPPDSGRGLYEGYAGRKRLWEFPGEDHWRGSNRPAEFYDEVWRWIGG